VVRATEDTGAGGSGHEGPQQVESIGVAASARQCDHGRAAGHHRPGQGQPAAERGQGDGAGRGGVVDGKPRDGQGDVPAPQLTGQVHRASRPVAEHERRDGQRQLGQRGHHQGVAGPGPGRPADRIGGGGGQDRRREIRHGFGPADTYPAVQVGRSGG
jgi:hypothetical protein